MTVVSTAMNMEQSIGRRGTGCNVASRIGLLGIKFGGSSTEIVTRQKVLLVADRN
jgi:hypothetical protein